jgi:hypothetical protein
MVMRRESTLGVSHPAAGRTILGRMAARLSFDLAARRGRFCAVPPAATA